MEDIQITLAAARVNAGLKQDDVARILHVSKKSVVNWENGRVQPSAATMYALSGIYHMPLNILCCKNNSLKVDL